MNNKVKTILCVGMAGAMMTASLAGCGSSGSGTAATAGNEQAETSAVAESTVEQSAGENDGLSFAGDIVGQGAVALDIYVNEMQYDFEMLGSDFQIYNDNFTADTQMQNIETMASKGYNGIMVYGWNASSYASISDIYKTAQIPFVIFDQIPRDDESIAMMDANEYYVGSIGADSYAEGVNAAQSMLDKGLKTAIILAGAVGDTIHDARVAGFTETFEKGGGSVLSTGRCSDPSEGTTKFDDMLSANKDVEGAYCLSGDYAIAAIAATSNHADSNVKIFISGATTETIPYIKDGTIAYADSGAKIIIPVAAALLKNYVQGNVIKDADGNAPYFGNFVPFEVTAENADKFSDLFLTGHPLEQTELKELVGPDVTYEDFKNFIETYSMG